MINSTKYLRHRPIGTAILAAGASLLLAVGWAPAQTLSTAFGPSLAIPVGAEGESVAIGDLNGDGRNDVVLGTGYASSNTNRQSILIFFQNEAGGLSNPVRYAVGSYANSVVIGDFTGDHRNDIAVGREGAGIRVFAQGPAGTFESFVDYATPNANWICTGDFNHDGRSDLAGIGWGSSVVDLFLQTAAGTMSLAAPLPANYSGWNDLEAGDVNHDGLTDIIVMSGQGAGPHLNVLLQTASGFAATAPYFISGTAVGVGGDLTGDGLADIALAMGGNRPSSKLALMAQKSDGTLTPGAVMDSYDIPEAVAVADVDLDERADVLILHGGWQRVGVYFQTAPGNLGTEMLFPIPYASHYNPHGIAVGDITGDQMPDVVLADYNNGLVILTNRLVRPIRQLTETSVSAGTARFRLNGPVGNRYAIQASSNLVNWVPLVTNTIPAGGSIWVEDSSSGLHSRRFYRANALTPEVGSNDSFNNRVSIASAGDTVLGSNVGATKEPGERNHAGDPGGKSVWWTWTAPASGPVAIFTDGSLFDTTLAVYRGADLGSLLLTAEDDDSGEGGRSRVIFNASAGVAYQIAVDGYGGQSGSIKVTVKRGVGNDAFASRWTMLGSQDAVVGYNIGATREAGEPYHWQNTGGASAWWTWQAPQTGGVTFSTYGSTFDTVLAAYTGSQVTGLSLIANNDDYDTDGSSQISFFATAGTVYQIAVDGYGGVVGTIWLQVQQ